MIENQELIIDNEILTTNDLVLRPPHSEDAQDLRKLANNINIAKNLATMPFPYFDADAHSFLKKVTGSANTGYTFAITNAETGEMMGICGLHEANARYELPYIGYWLGETYWGNGYATQAARALVDLFFKTGTQDAMMISCIRDNAASRRVIEKCGGVYWKPSEEFASTLGQNHLMDNFRITRETWMGAVAA